MAEYLLYCAVIFYICTTAMSVRQYNVMRERAVDFAIKYNRYSMKKSI